MRKTRPTNVTCVFCEKEFYKRPSTLKLSKSGLFFCCINRDRSNNKLENLEVLCARCHAIEHWS